MGFLDWMGRRSASTPDEKGLVASGPMPNSTSKELIHESLLEVSFVVDSMARSDPDHRNWHKFEGDFDKSVVGMKKALRAYARDRKNEVRTARGCER
jgi:hypothetical protein